MVEIISSRQITLWFVAFITFIGITESLKCWHCVADNCEEDPQNNYKASQKTCLEGQICQKVYFEMYSTEDDVKYKSLVRSCAEDCSSSNDFYNCSNDLYTTRGCIKRSCCDDEDLCNNSHKNFTAFTIQLIIVVCGILMFFGN
ncbi:hypothetical protein LOTGIDRAFT_173458 [Lottia gigantea]|uniref:UPAR/Ly6 domain-containing protein n=1 Tax=Lottia gigantea TaxID=225164 RepID=V4CD92_LOTGI|nr:hypothetical protein LOTGIDRAFT_173458 [Lottia gigantea]ESO99854.1 hypothetical protein LOTGIDRAFT_173458 [Lottia gigantea]